MRKMGATHVAHLKYADLKYMINFVFRNHGVTFWANPWNLFIQGRLNSDKQNQDLPVRWQQPSTGIRSWFGSKEIHASWAQFKMAWHIRYPDEGLIFHSDRGVQYCSEEFKRQITQYEMRSPMSRRANCWDNAPTESFWGSLKVGRLYGQRFATRRDAMDEVISWMSFYNFNRLHSTLAYVSPMEFEEQWYASRQKRAA